MIEKMPLAHQNTQYKCAQCRWLYIGYEGVTCQQKRGATIHTQACIEFDPYRPSTFDKVCRDKLLVELQKKVETIDAGEIKRIADELKGYRITLKPKTSDFSQYTEEKDMLEITHKFERCASYMDRVVEIQMDLMDRQNVLTELMKSAQAHIFAHYTDQLRALKNDSERGAFYKGVLPALFSAIDALDGLSRKVDLVQKNLSNTHFSLKERQLSILKVWDYRMHSLSARSAVRG